MNRICFCLLTFAFCLVFAQGYYEFGPSIIVNDDPPGTHYHYLGSAGRHGIACSGDRVYVVWSDDRNGYNAVYFSKSIDAGQTWGANVSLSSFVTSAPSIALDNHNNIYLTFNGNPGSNIDVYFSKSTDGGITFTSPIIVNDSTREIQNTPSIAVDSSGQNVFVAFADWRNPVGSMNIDVYCARSTDGGASFDTEVRVDDTQSDSSWQERPSIGCSQSGDTVYIAWMDNRNIDYDICFARSIDTGQTFGANIFVNDSAGINNTTQWYPSLSIGRPSSIYIGWADFRSGDWRIYCDKSADGGMTFNQDIIVSDTTSPSSIYPSLVADDSHRVYAVWRDTRTFSSTGHDIYFSYSSDSGNTFSSDVRVNDLEGIQSAWDWDANVTVNKEGKVFVAWRSDRNDPSGNYWDIYSAAGTFVGIQEYSNKTTQLSLICYPNPFRLSTTIKIQAPSEKLQTPNSKFQNYLRIYDVSGRLVKSFVVPSSYFIVPTVISWSGTDQANHPVPAGVYFCQLNHGEVMYSKKIIKIE